MAEEKRVAVVTGGNKGIGFATCKLLAEQGHKVVLTARDEGRGKKAASELSGKGLDVVFHQLDVTDDNSIEELASWLDSEFGRADALVNNAGVMIDGGGVWGKSSALEPEYDVIRKTMETNVYGALKVANALVPLMKKNGYGRIVNLSSGMGQLSDMNGGFPGYRISKAAINAVTRMLASELSGTNILVNSASPGWVATDMGGHSAPRSPEEGADTSVYLATLPDGGPTGGFFKDRQPIDW